VKKSIIDQINKGLRLRILSIVLLTVLQTTLEE